ncbi:14381_t:CDS:2 [Dentiscutata erythropus]|uniref:14381_t:CDS:1 n=1 Tax=Dentiscutata erythropus TaxID=1348616 RepID=A0A9N9AKF1_9GLOM|nr:14381_t:CDS:2 [Dentiscutata erythropus]
MALMDTMIIFKYLSYFDVDIFCIRRQRYQYIKEDRPLTKDFL